MTGFVVEGFDWLHKDPQDTSTALLREISHQLSGSTNVVPSTQPPFAPSCAVITINALWFISLTLSLMAALTTILIQQWVRRYNDFPSSIDPEHKACLRQRRYEALNIWLVPQIISSLSVLLQVSLFLFLAGVVTLVWTLNTTVAIVTSFITALFSVGFLLTAILPLVDADCPYKSPLAWATYIVVSQLSTLPSRFICLVTRRHQLYKKPRKIWVEYEHDARADHRVRAVVWTLQMLRPSAPEVIKALIQVINPDCICESYLKWLSCVVDMPLDTVRRFFSRGEAWNLYDRLKHQDKQLFTAALRIACHEQRQRWPKDSPEFYWSNRGDFLGLLLALTPRTGEWLSPHIWGPSFCKIATDWPPPPGSIHDTQMLQYFLSDQLFEYVSSLERMNAPEAQEQVRAVSRALTRWNRIMFSEEHPVEGYAAMNALARTCLAGYRSMILSANLHDVASMKATFEPMCTSTTSHHLSILVERGFTIPATPFHLRASILEPFWMPHGEQLRQNMVQELDAMLLNTDPQLQPGESPAQSYTSHHFVREKVIELIDRFTALTLHQWGGWGIMLPQVAELATRRDSSTESLETLIAEHCRSKSPMHLLQYALTREPPFPALEQLANHPVVSNSGSLSDATTDR